MKAVKNTQTIIRTVQNKITNMCAMLQDYITENNEKKKKTFQLNK